MSYLKRFFTFSNCPPVAVVVELVIAGIGQVDPKTCPYTVKSQKAVLILRKH